MSASRNRTLAILPGEQEELQPLVTEQPEFLSFSNCHDVLVHADLLDVIDAVPDHSVPLIVLDPPYNLSRDFHGLRFAARSAGAYAEYLASWLPQVVRKLSPVGTLYMCGDWHCSSAMQAALEDCGLHVINRITWQREKGRGASRNWKNAMEDIWMAVADPLHYTFNIDDVKVKRRVVAPYRSAEGEPKDWEATSEGNFRITFPSNFWDDITVPFWSMPENTDHPTQKPEKLLAKLILASSNPGDLVFDPMAGSGTTCVTAKKLGRHYLGIEMNPEYCLWAAKRLRLADTSVAIQGYEDGVFWERNAQNSRRSR